jgi:hypothetical protein
MKVDYLIIQAGGRGTRLGTLTRNRPKALVPVSNVPIIMRLFETFKDSRFLILGDYKAEVLKRYLETFATVDYCVLKPQRKGNVAGVKTAIDLIPSGATIGIVWSDLVFPDGFSTSFLESGNYVGTIDGSPCSWGFSDDGFARGTVRENGVAGFFIFEDKTHLSELAEEGSFTTWLAAHERSIPLRNLRLGATKEFGTLEAFKSVENEKPTRPYNRIAFSDLIVTKKAITSEGAALLAREVAWYKEAERLKFLSVPKIYSLEPLEMERLNCETVSASFFSKDLKRVALKSIVDTLHSMHSLDQGPVDVTALYNNYYRKTLVRLAQVRGAIPLSDNPEILINGVRCKNILFYKELFEHCILSVLPGAQFGFIHGDCTLSNVFFRNDASVVFIDPRGYFCPKGFLGDVDYDWVKLYFSICGNFDQFNLRNFSLDIEDGAISVSVESSGWEWLVDDFFTWASVSDKKVRLLHAIVWLSLASHCSDDLDSMAAAFYIGLQEFSKWTRDFEFDCAGIRSSPGRI